MTEFVDCYTDFIDMFGSYRYLDIFDIYILDILEYFLNPLPHDYRYSIVQVLVWNGLEETQAHWQYVKAIATMMQIALDQVDA